MVGLGTPLWNSAVPILNGKASKIIFPISPHHLVSLSTSLKTLIFNRGGHILIFTENFKTLQSQLRDTRAFPVDPSVPKTANTAREECLFAVMRLWRGWGLYSFQTRNGRQRTRDAKDPWVYRPSAPIKCWEIILPFTHPALTSSESNGNLLKGLCLTWNSF